MSTYLCSRCGLIVRTDQRAVHDKDHAQQEANTKAIGTLSAGGSGPTVTTRASYHQTTPAAQWTWAHNLAGYPPITLFADDDPTQPCFTDLTYTDANTVLIEWPEPTAGWAFI